MFKKYELKDYRFNLVVLLIALTSIGIMVVGSALESVQNKQFIGMILGIIVMLVISLLDYSYILRFYWIMYGISVILLLAVQFFGKEVNGSKRWLDIGFQFQPSEVCKILLILFFARYLMLRKDNINTFRSLCITGILMLIPVILIEEQPDLSTTITVAFVLCMLLYVSGLSYKLIGTVLAIVVPCAIVFLTIVIQPDQTLLKDYQRDRIMAWLNPEEYSNSTGYQQSNAIMAIGSGQLYGKGLNNNSITSVKNGNFIAEPETDFIFAIVGEELGFVGSVIIIGLIGLIVFTCIMIGRRAKDLAGTLICVGMASLVGFQSFVNIGVATGVLPNTGIPLPFVSYGLTSLVSLYIGMGFVLNVGLQPKKY
ncbi:MAG: rod shape-determining protein RodA [Lachnospiraceae bacterium]|nr:rod shape-determining protein RodA [Lachnospiraceae bacterium]